MEDKSQKKPLEIPTVFLIDASVISSSETITGIIDHYQLCDIIGENTAGANGDVALVNTPIFDITYTGMRVDKHNGDTFFGTGYKPHMHIKKTLQDLINKQDPQMQKAIETIILKNTVNNNKTPVP
jgi:C-terminal processing protease CtpA/Prc